MTDTGVHITHCCILHGCKYGDDDCPVVTGLAKQKFLCEDCYNADIKILEDIDNYKHGICPHCGQPMPDEEKE